MVWNVLSDDRGGFRVRLLPGSAKFVERSHALFHHSYQSILGAKENGTLRITPDDFGVKVEIDLPDTQTARDVAKLVEDKYVRGMSFSMLFDPKPEFTTKSEGGIEIQEVSSFSCDEVTVTAIPSFTETTIGLAGEQDADDKSDTAAAPEPVQASARVEQTIRLERLRLENMRI
jgi:HK97 family phage prohead protease